MANTKNKEDAAINYFEMVKNSWTYGRMTEEEQKEVMFALSEADCQGLLSGGYDQRWKQCNAIYTAFLYALGYRKERHLWRETNRDDDTPFC